MIEHIDTAAEREWLAVAARSSVGFHELRHRSERWLDAFDAKDAEIERLRDILRTIISRAQNAKRHCENGYPISAYNLASEILGQIGLDVVALSGEGAP